MIKDIQKEVIAELKEYYPAESGDSESLPRVMEKIYAATGQTFIILIDEWDCLFREYKNSAEAQKMYLDFLRNWLKDRAYVGLAYMTGILPIKKYGSHSALNMFNEFTMTGYDELAPYFGFTETEVQTLCSLYEMNFEEAKVWYDGYLLDLGNVGDKPENRVSMYSPKSVVEAMKRHSFGTYWNQTETYEALQNYIKMNFEGLKDDVVIMLAGGNVKININKFANDMTNLNSKDDVFTLLIHLGYLTYDKKTETVKIPNKEVTCEYLNVLEDSSQWGNVIKAIENSRNLLLDLWNREEKR